MFKKDKTGLILSLTLVLGALLYFIFTTNPQFFGIKQEDAQTQKLLMQSNSDEVESIENDLYDTDLENLDQELQYIESEIDREI